MRDGRAGQVPRRGQRRRPAATGPRRLGRTAAWALLAVVAAVTAARLHGGGPPQPAPELAAFFGYAVWACALGAVLAGAARDRRTAGVAVLVGLCLAGFQGVTASSYAAPTSTASTSTASTSTASTSTASTSTASTSTASTSTASTSTASTSTSQPPHSTASTSTASTGPAGGRPLQVLTVNAHLGTADAAWVVRTVRSRQIDLLAVQELTPDLVDRLQAAGLSQVLANHQVDARPGAAGCGLWSRLPLAPSTDLPGMLFAAPRAVLTTPAGRQVRVTVLHPVAPRPGAEQLWQQDLLTAAGALAGERGPQLVLGDLNSDLSHQGLRALADTGLRDAAVPAPAWLASWAWPVAGTTWPADRPGPALLRIDHVLVTPTDFSVRRWATLPVPGSDHRALVVTLLPTGR